MLSHGQRSSAESATPWAEKNVPEHTHPAPLPPTSHSHKNRDSHIHSSNVNDSLNNNNNNKNNNDDDDVSTDNNSSSVAGVAGSAVEQPKQHGSRIPPWPLRNDSCMREPRDGSSLRILSSHTKQALHTSLHTLIMQALCACLSSQTKQALHTSLHTLIMQARCVFLLRALKRALDRRMRRVR